MSDKPANDGSFDDADEKQRPGATLTVLAIDAGTVPRKKCANGHIIEWYNESTNTSASLLSKVQEDGTWVSLCAIDGKPAALEPAGDGKWRQIGEAA